ncbi:MAG: DNA-protecting protein DprA [Clostridia bacterium]|nr:DNA-protecting protein DprA [Clostridia bacterium]
MSFEERLKSKIISIPRGDKLYPKAWEYLDDAPETLYAVGNVSLLARSKFVVIGSRRTPVNAMKLGETIARELSSQFVIVTGAADGGDTAAITGALKSGVICLLAGGFSAIPQANLPLLERVAENGLLLSVHPFEMPVRSFSYEYRNKLMAALGDGVLVLGAGEKSGALITAKYAQEFSKKIFAIPYPPNAAAGAGCNALIKKGGYLTESAADVFAVYGIDASQTKIKIELSADEEKAYNALREISEGHINEVATATGIPVFKLRAVLSALEIKGLATALGGNRYSVV